MSDVPQFVNEGTYGCVHRPSLQCDKDYPVINYSDKVSKILSSKHAKQELNEYAIIKNLDKKKEFHLGEPINCKYANTDVNLEAIKKCDLYKYLKKRKYELIVMEDGGDNLKDFTTIVNSDKFNKEEKTVIMKKFWREALRLLYGVKQFIKYDMVHYDIKPHNIVYDMKKNRCNFIDFGLMKNISFMKKYNDSHYWWNYPIESDFVKKHVFEFHKKEYIKKKDPRVFFVENKKNKDQLATFFVYSGLDKENRNQEYLMNWYNFIKDHINEYSHEKFVNKHFNTRDSYALGMSLLYVLNETVQYIEPNKYISFKNLFESMFDSNLIDRIEIDEAIERYEDIILESQMKKVEDYNEAVLKSKVKENVESMNVNKKTANKIASLEPPIEKTTKPLKTKNIKYTKNITVKPCPEGKIRNPTTNRCIKNPANKTQKKCPEGKRLNPTTNRCVKDPANKSAKKCPEGKRLNPTTNRCIKIR